MKNPRRNLSEMGNEGKYSPSELLSVKIFCTLMGGKKHRFSPESTMELLGLKMQQWSGVSISETAYFQ